MFSVSVIIPNYNNEKYLGSCLQSVISQTYPIKEIVVYDDCSTDHSKNILDEYRKMDDRLKVVYGTKNVGVSVARDIAIKHTTGDYVCMLDADDFFYTDKKIENEMMIVTEEFRKSGKKIICFSQTVDVDEKGECLNQVEQADLRGNERFKIITRQYSNYMPRDYCFPRELYDACGGYTPGLSLFEDWELNIKFLDYTDFVYSGSLGTAYRHKSGGLSSVNYTKQFVTKVKIFTKYRTSLKEKICFYAIAFGALGRNYINKVGGVLHGN